MNAGSLGLGRGAVDTSRTTWLWETSAAHALLPRRPSPHPQAESAGDAQLLTVATLELPEEPEQRCALVHQPALSVRTLVAYEGNNQTNWKHTRRIAT